MHSYRKRSLFISSLLLAALLNAQPPADWTVNPSDYEHVMTITAQVRINGFPADSNLVLAAFVGNECRGVINAINVMDNWLHFLMVRANGSGEQISFQVWDGNLDTVLGADNLVLFSSDAAYGTVDIPYLIEAHNQYTLLVANTDTVTLDEDIATELTVLDNDQFSTATFQQLVILQVPANGSALVNANETISYSPDQDWFGTDSLSYIITNTWYADTAKVIINVSAINDAPGQYDLLTPTNSTSITITEDNLSEELIFRWDRTIDAEGSQVTYSSSFTGNLNVLTIPVTSDTSVTMSYTNILSAISDNGYSSITGTWQIIASDSELERSADNGPFSLTIDASSVSIKSDNQLPGEFRLYGNYPNPFNPATTIKYSLPYSVYVRIEIFDLTGRLVHSIPGKHQEAGTHTILWSPSNNLDNDVSGGVYFYRLWVDDITRTGKMLFLK